jgi:hypothetical protein
MIYNMTPLNFQILVRVARYLVNIFLNLQRPNRYGKHKCRFCQLQASLQFVLRSIRKIVFSEGVLVTKLNSDKNCTRKKRKNIYTILQFAG